MPKETFYNLPDEKKQLIENIAIDEFAEYGFDKASINRMVITMQIAKGSFYQYFEDKKDLFSHLIQCVGEKKLAYMSPVLANPDGHDFFIILEALYHSGLAFAKENPKAALLGNQYYTNKDHPELKEIFRNNIHRARDFYGNLVDTAISRGEVRPNINRDFTIHMLITMNVSLLEYYFEEVLGQDFDLSHMEDDIMDTIKLSLDFIKNGIGITHTGETNDD
ncbi:MAG: TetR/AcrR family transcriptional regulator [Phototrophicaceae bacterium]